MSTARWCLSYNDDRETICAATMEGLACLSGITVSRLRNHRSGLTISKEWTVEKVLNRYQTTEDVIREVKQHHSIPADLKAAIIRLIDSKLKEDTEI